MKKITIYIFCLLYFPNIIGQSRYSECKDINYFALSDFNRGKFVKLFLGLESGEDIKFERFYKIYLNSKFNIKTRSTGCVVTQEIVCYSKTMDSLINNKYGKNFYLKLRDSLKNIYPKMTETEKSKILNPDFTYNFF